MLKHFVADVFYEGRMVIHGSPMRAVFHLEDGGRVSHWHGSFEVVPVKWAVADGRELTLQATNGEACRVVITHVRPMDNDEIQVCYNGVGEPPASLMR
ncbi:MAG TPA: hypothetical protein VFE58_02560 [Tepidisphaeraceae bacterium]|jgi:hypothetical protein|nr:hypothetical protein [Tepidisphaeraceae bacterium]